MRIESLLKPEHTLFLVDPIDRDAVLLAIATAAAEGFSDLSAENLQAALIERESQMPTATPEGVAFPHAMLPGLEDTVLIPAIIRPPIVFSTREPAPVSLAFGMFGDANKPWDHVRLLARLARIARGEGALERIQRAQSADDLFQHILAEDRSYDA